MAFQLELRPTPPLPLTPECLVHTGIARLFVTGVLVQGSGAPPEQFGFFVPTATALPEGTPEPRLLAEAHLMTGIATSTSGNFPFGVEYVRAAYAPDPRRHRPLALPQRRRTHRPRNPPRLSGDGPDRQLNCPTAPLTPPRRGAAVEDAAALAVFVAHGPGQLDLPGAEFGFLPAGASASSDRAGPVGPLHVITHLPSDGQSLPARSILLAGSRLPGGESSGRFAEPARQTFVQRLLIVSDPGDMAVGA